MTPILLASGSNASAQLSIDHSKDVHSFTRCQFHHSIEHLLPASIILDLVSSSTHALLLLRDRHGVQIVLGAGTNSLGQLGPRCALWDEVKPEPRFKPVDLLGPLGMSTEEWEPVRIAATWTTSFVVYRQRAASEGGANGNQESGVQEMVLACGSNDFGELGSGRPETGHIAVTEASDLPSIVPLGLRAGESVELLKGGQRHIVAVIKDQGGKQRVVGWGASRKGELDPATLSSNASSSGSGAGMAQNRKGKGKATAVAPTSPPTAIAVPRLPGEKVVDIALGSAHSLALLDSGRVLAWGNDAKGQITSAHESEGVNQIAATWGGSYFLRGLADSPMSLLSQGANSHSQLLRPEGPPRGDVMLPEAAVKRLVAGSEHLLVHAGEDVWVGGWNEHGNLGLGDTADRDPLVKVDMSAYGDKRVQGVWAGCAASWIWLDNR